MKQRELKAIGWFCEKYGLKPQLSVPPSQMHFTNRRTGQTESHHLDKVVLEYGEQLKEEQKRKRREKKNERI